MPSDLDAERELVDCLIVDSRCNATLAVEPFFDPHCQRFYALSQASGQRGERPVSKRPVSKRPVSKRPVSKRPVSKRPVSKRPVSKAACLESGLARRSGRWTLAEAPPASA